MAKKKTEPTFDGIKERAKLQQEFEDTRYLVPDFDDKSKTRHGSFRVQEEPIGKFKLPVRPSVKHDPNLEYHHHGVVGCRARRGVLGEWDKTIMQQVQEHYTFKGLDYAQQQNVLDVGCNIGAFSLYVLALNPSAQVIGVEVDTENATIASQNLAGLATLYHARLGYEHGDFVLERVPTCAGSYSVVKRGTDRVHPGFPDQKLEYAEIAAPLISLEEIMKLHSWERINVLKLDCEGAEYDIIPHARLETLVSVDHIVGEYHDGIERFEADCMPILKEHFEVMHLQKTENWGRFWLRRWGK